MSPEITFLDVAQCIALVKKLSKEDISGVTVRKETGICAAMIRLPVKVLDALPFPVPHQELIHALGGAYWKAEDAGGMLFLLYQSVLRNSSYLIWEGQDSGEYCEKEI